MKKDNNLVRKLESAEVLARVDTICTDKTGTLTKNKMKVREFYTMDQFIKGNTSNFSEL